MTSEAPDGLPPRQVFIKCSGSGARLMTHVGAVEEFFSEDAISVVNAWGETPADGKLQVVALVSFGDDAALERALARDGEVLDGQMVSIAKNAQPYRKRKRALGSVWVYVGNCPLDATDEALRQAFAEVGTVISVRIGLHDDGRPRGFAHVCFEDTEGDGKTAEKAIALDGVVQLGDRTLSVKAATDKKRAREAEWKTQARKMEQRHRQKAGSKKAKGRRDRGREAR